MEAAAEGTSLGGRQVALSVLGIRVEAVEDQPHATGPSLPLVAPSAPDGPTAGANDRPLAGGPYPDRYRSRGRDKAPRLGSAAAAERLVERARACRRPPAQSNSDVYNKREMGCQNSACVNHNNDIH